MARPQNSLKNSLIQELKSLVLLGSLVIALRALVFEPFFIPTGSMKPGLLEGDYILATKYNYGYSKYSVPFITLNLFEGRVLNFKGPKRGDVVVFFVPSIQERYIKRVIGLPGDKIQMINSNLYINDKKVDRAPRNPYQDQLNNKFYKNSPHQEAVEQGISTVYDQYMETLPNGLQYCTLNLPPAEQDLTIESYTSANNTTAFLVPEGKYFVMGDNRDNSYDSRIGLGFIEEDQIIGKARLIWFSTSRPLWVGHNIVRQAKQLWHWASSIRWLRIGSVIS